MPVIIEAEAPEEALAPRRSTEPSARTIRIQELAEYADAVMQKVKEKGAATVDFTDSDFTGPQFVNGLRSALARHGAKDILVKAVRNRKAAVAWKIRAVDRPIIEKRRQRGLELGAMRQAQTQTARAPETPRARARAQTARAPETPRARAQTAAPVALRGNGNRSRAS